MFANLLLGNIRLNFRRYASTTIFSLSSGKGKCGVSVIRVSGPQTMKAVRAIVNSEYTPKARVADLRSFKHPLTKEVIDRGLILWFPGPYSFTGEDSCEFQVHGSIAVISAMLEALGQISGLRQALPGEFTKRAFFGGKLDLTEVDGLADLIHSETEAQRKQALYQSGGALSKLYNSWRKRLIHCVAHLEAFIDFSEDENIEDDVVFKLNAELEKLKKSIKSHLNDARQGELIKDGIRTAIIGKPNVGKSSFMNMICQRQVSIVTDIAGTTRDLVETTFNISGYPVVFTDTAGLRTETTDLIEMEGIKRAKDQILKADLILLIVDATEILGFKDIVEFKAKYMKTLGIESEAKVFFIGNKVDLIETTNLKEADDLVFISCKDNVNVDGLLAKLTTQLEALCGEPTAENPRLSNSRYRHELKKCVETIDIFLKDYNPSKYHDLAIAAQKLRQAVKCIERITGHVSNDEILDVVFRDFCIGK